MSNYEIRKKYRAELHAARCADHDQSAERYMRDAKTLNDWLAFDGITDQREARWGR